MKKLRTQLKHWIETWGHTYWRTLPVSKQRRYLLSFFGAYLLITIMVLLKVGCDVRKSTSRLNILHIENPVLTNQKSPASVQDTLSTTLKK